MMNNTGLQLRKATIDDMDLLYSWVNDPVVRLNSFDSSVIPYSTHKTWFAEQISNPNVAIYIGIKDSIPVGQIRITIDNEIAEITYSVSSEFRGEHIGSELLFKLEEKILVEYPEVIRLRGYVKLENIASRKTFSAEHYNEQKITKSSNSVFLYEKTLLKPVNEDLI